jgi:hypothetical protein
MSELWLPLLLAAVAITLVFIPSIRILHRMGYSGWWVLSYLFPPLMVVLVWIVSFKNWPVQSRKHEQNLTEGEYLAVEEDSSESDWKENAGTVFGCLGAIVLLGYGLVVLAVGSIGIEEELGPWWAFGAVLLALVLRFTLPITVGAIFGAMHLWDWHWMLATIFAMPGLVFMVPAVVYGLYETVRRR